MFLQCRMTSKLSSFRRICMWSFKLQFPSEFLLHVQKREAFSPVSNMPEVNCFLAALPLTNTMVFRDVGFPEVTVVCWTNISLVLANVNAQLLDTKCLREQVDLTT